MIALKNGYLIDGQGGSPSEGATVLIEGKTICCVGTADVIPKGAFVIDLQGRTILPGLIDTHIHAGGFYRMRTGEMVYGGGDFSLDFADARIQSLDYGVTTWRSGGDFFEDMKTCAARVASGELQGSRIFTHSPFFTVTGGHPGWTVMRGDPYVLERTVICVDHVTEARERIRETVEAGADYIKIVLSGYHNLEYPKRIPKMSYEVMRALIEETHKLHKRATVHCEGPADVIEAVDAQADSIEHLYLPGCDLTELPDSVFDKIAKQGTWLSPTLFSTFLTEQRAPKVPARYQMLKDAVQRAYEAGVKFSVGTDSGTPGLGFGISVHKEMQQLNRCGVPKMDVILAATGNAAACMGKEQEFGTVAEGKSADLLIVEGNPLEDIACTENICLVIKEGQIVRDYYLSKNMAKAKK